MSGQRIDDHGFWAGKGSKESVLPKGVHTKTMDSAVGAGTVGRYEDTESAIKGVQEANIRKAKSQAMKEGYFH